VAKLTKKLKKKKAASLKLQATSRLDIEAGIL